MSSALAECLLGEQAEGVLRVMANPFKQPPRLVSRQWTGRYQHAGKAAVSRISGNAGDVSHAVQSVAQCGNCFDRYGGHATGGEREGVEAADSAPEARRSPAPAGSSVWGQWSWTDR